MIYLVQSFPDGWGGVRLTAESMRLFLASWKEGHGDSSNLTTNKVGGTDQWKMFMKLHLAERDPQHHAWPKRGVEDRVRISEPLRLRILLSYWYYKDVDLDTLFAKYFTQPYPDVFADSGAFSAMTQGSPISLTEYAVWLRRWRHLFTTYANLDVIKDAEGTWHNQVELEDKHGLEPLPCFHVLEDWSWLEHYVARYPYIALGVAAMQNRKDALMRWLVQCFKIAGQQSVFHGFGLTSWQVMASFPWYSVDSSSWGQGFRYGSVPVFDSQRGRFYKLRLGDRSAWIKYAKLVRALGFEPVDFYDRTQNSRAKICALSALSYMLAERWLRNHWGEVRIPNRQDAPVGLRAHLVTGADSDGDGRGGNMSLKAMAQAGLGADASGLRLHLADTSNGINYSDADKGVKLHLVEIMPDIKDIRSVSSVLGVSHDSDHSQ